MGLIEELLAGAAGYTVSELSKSHPLRDAIDERINRSKQYLYSGQQAGSSSAPDCNSIRGV